MTEKGAAVVAVVVILLLGVAHAAYGYWTDRIGVKEDFAVVWPVEVEIEEESEETVEITETKESIEVTEPVQAENDVEVSETEPDI